MTDSKQVVIIASAYGVETAELLEPKKYLENAGHTVTVATPKGAPIQTLVLDKDLGPTLEPDTDLATIDAANYDLLVIPGGTINADSLRLEAEAKRIAKDFAAAGKPIAAICHAPWLVVEADLAVGKTLTSYSSLRTDINNAGGTWVDEPVQVDDTNGFTLITSRTPDDMASFTSAIGTELA